MTELLLNTPFRILLLVVVFAASVGAVYAAAASIMRRSQMRRQMAALHREADAGPTAALVGTSTKSPWMKIVEIVEKSGISLSDSAPDALRAKLVAAGFSSPDAPRIYSLIRLAMIFVFPTLLIVVLVSTGAQISIFKLYVVGSICALFGLIMPTWILRIVTDRRKEAITNGFPNCLDLMLVCVEAGLGIEAAFERVGRELASAAPEVSELIVRTTHHLRAGASRDQALRRMADYAGVSEVRSFCTLLIQSEKLGTSIATTLRVFAHEMRERRQMRAEEKAHRLPVLISIPLIVCMLPTMVGVLMLPAVIRVIRQLVPAMGG